PPAQTTPFGPQVFPSQSLSAQSAVPSQSLSSPSAHASSIAPPGQLQVLSLPQRRSRGPQLDPAGQDRVSAQSTRPLPSSSLPLPQISIPWHAGSAAQSESAQSTAPSQSSSLPSWQRDSWV